MPFKIAGSKALVPQEADLDYVPGEGYTTTLKYRQTAAEVRHFLPLLVRAGLRHRVIGDGPVQTVVVTIAAALDGAAEPADVNDQLTVKWARVRRREHKDIFDHANFTALSTTEQAALRNYRDKGTVPSGLTGDAAKFQTLILRKVFHFFTGTTVLRKVAVAPNSWSGTHAVTNELSVYTTRAAMMTAESVPNDLKFALPNTAWFKEPATVEQRPDGKWEFRNEFVSVPDYSDVLYDTVS